MINISKVQIFYSKKENMYFTKEFLYCDKCGKEISYIAIIYHLVNKFENIIKAFCLEHKDEEFSLKQYPFMERFEIIIDEFIPKDSLLLMDWNVSLSERNMSVFDISQKSLHGEQIEDNTVYAGRESFDGVTIGKDIILELEKKDNLFLDYNGVDKFFGDIKSSKAIGYDDKPLPKHITKD